MSILFNGSISDRVSIQEMERNVAYMYRRFYELDENRKQINELHQELGELWKTNKCLERDLENVRNRLKDLEIKDALNKNLK